MSPALCGLLTDPTIPKAHPASPGRAPLTFNQGWFWYLQVPPPAWHLLSEGPEQDRAGAEAPLEHLRCCSGLRTTEHKDSGAGGRERRLESGFSAMKPRICQERREEARVGRAESTAQG